MKELSVISTMPWMGVAGGGVWYQKCLESQKDDFACRGEFSPIDPTSLDRCTEAWGRTIQSQIKFNENFLLVHFIETALCPPHSVI